MKGHLTAFSGPLAARIKSLSQFQNHQGNPKTGATTYSFVNSVLHNFEGVVFINIIWMVPPGGVLGTIAVHRDLQVKGSLVVLGVARLKGAKQWT